MNVKIVRSTTGAPPGKLADAELHFGEGLLAGLKRRFQCVGASRGSWTERDVSGKAVLGQRRTASLRPAEGHRRTRHLGTAA